MLRLRQHQQKQNENQIVAKGWASICYLNSRKQYTHIENYCSDVTEVRYGVPQGSVLRPILFLICINDICRAVPKATVKLYADDTNVFLFDKDGRTLNSEANLCLQEL